MEPLVEEDRGRERERREIETHEKGNAKRKECEGKTKAYPPKINGFQSNMNFMRSETAQ
jgi:hypothetical protein